MTVVKCNWVNWNNNLSAKLICLEHLKAHCSLHHYVGNATRHILLAKSKSTKTCG